MGILLTSLSDDVKRNDLIGEPAASNSALNKVSKIAMDMVSFNESMESISELSGAMKDKAEKNGISISDVEFKLNVSTKGKVGVIFAGGEIGVGATISLKLKL